MSTARSIGQLLSSIRRSDPVSRSRSSSDCFDGHVDAPVVSAWVARRGSAGQPLRALEVESLDRFPGQTGEPCFDGEAGLRLQVSEVAVADGEAAEQDGVELDAGCRIDGIE